MTRAMLVQVVGRNTAWLYAAEFLPRLGALAIVPLWSARVRPAEYGLWIVSFTTIELLLEVSGLGLANFIAKVIYRYRDERADAYVGMAGAVLLGMTAVVAASVAAASPWLTASIVGDDVRTDLFAVLAIYLVAAQFNNLALGYVGNRVNYGGHFLLVTLRWAGNTALLLLFLLRYEQGFYSWVWAATLTEIVLLPVSAALLRHVRWRRWRRRMLKFAIRFSLPTVVTNFTAWAQQRTGRYVLSFAGLGTGLGLYGVAQNFAQSYGGVVRPAKMVALTVLGHRLEDEAESPYFVEFFHLFACVALAAAFLVALFLDDVTRLLVAGPYHEATPALAPLVFALYFQELYSVYAQLMFRYFKVWFHCLGSLVAFPVVLGVNLLLVPAIGFVGAAVAQLAGAGAALIFAHQYANRVSWRPFRIVPKLGFAVIALGLAVTAERLALPLATKAMIAVAVLIPYALFHWHSRGELFPSLAGIVAANRG